MNMDDSRAQSMALPPAQGATRAKCNHPSGRFTEFPLDDVRTSIPERFEKIVSRYPDRIAVKIGDQSVTYGELNGQANRLARVLLAETGDEAVCVGLLLNTGLPLLAGMLGVLKAGKLFALIDPSLPAARIASVVQDAQADLVIANQADLTTAAIPNPGFRVLQYNEVSGKIASDNLPLHIAPETLATIVYTSGSTGEPKGVVWDHIGLLHRNMTRTQESEPSDTDRIALLSSHAGNALNDIFLALLNGATLLPFDIRREGVIRFVSWMATEEVSICAISSPLFRRFCETLTGAESFPNLRIIRLRSDTVHPEDILLFKRFFPQHCVLVCGLSSSESGHLTTYSLNAAAELSGNEVPVGHPVADKEIILLDDQGREVNLGDVGEIVVRSRYLARGYWRQPELTKVKFRFDPANPTARFYFTGDLGSMRPDGCLIHKGRKDFRVKIRGNGVELGEVERVLRSHPAVSQAVAIIRENGSGENRIIAYYTSRESRRQSVSELRRFVNERLPDYMTPSAFVRLETFPLTSTGKVDRRSLPDPGVCRPDLDTPFLAPRTDAEKVVAQIFSECTGIERVGIDDSFFDLGGDSLISARLLSRLRELFQREFSMQEMFEFPTVAGIVSLLGASAQPAPAEFDPILSSFSKASELPLSFAQQRLWFLDQLDPGGFTYNLFSAYRVKGDLNIAAVQQSFNYILRRHQILRTVFKSVGGNPAQVVLPHLTIMIPTFDLRTTVSEKDRWTEVRRMFREEAQRSFDLAAGPLLRITLLQLADDEYVLLRAMHHTVYDGWSEGILFRELSQIYEALTTGKTPLLPDLRIQYADYAVWQRQWLANRRLESQLSYWKRQLENMATLQLPTDRPRRANHRSYGSRHYFTLSDALSCRLKELSSQHGVTLFMTLLAAFQTLLHRYTSQSDIIIGSPVAGRNRREFEELIGFFLNMLVLRLDLSGNPTFVEVIRRVRKVCLEALSHQELPFEKLVEELHPARDLGCNPLFQVSFAFQNTPRISPHFSATEVTELPVETGISRFDLHLLMEDVDGCLKGYLDYDTYLFNVETIERMIGHFQILLEGIVVKPERSIGELPLLTDVEKHRLFVEWNHTETDYPNDNCVHQLFEAQVEKNPYACAVVFEDQRLTYRELSNRANQLAHYLRKLGVGAEVLVGVCLERSVDMIVAMLAILKAGGVWVPLNPAYPRERISFILRDTQAAVLVTEARLIEEAIGDLADSHQTGSQPAPPHALPLKVICLDEHRAEISKENEQNTAVPSAPESLAYVIYTSGSTGKPKGVMIEHRSAAAFLHWAHSVFTKEELAGVIASTSICFDLSVFEIFAPLTAGGCVILVENALELVELESAVAPTLLNTVPSVMAELLRLGGLPRSIRTVNLAGEPLKPSVVAQIDRETAAEQIYDLYGPSETTTYSTYSRRAPDSVQTVGRPIANTQIYILDPYGNPTPIGVAGEIHIGGAGLARGYLGCPELTAEKFIPDPFSAEPGARLYRTGDIARYLLDGNIELTGRKDDQVKIRGLRIELGEIESILSSHPEVRDAVVIAREDRPGDKRLVAYVVGNRDEQPQPDELKQFLKTTLPDYMVPFAWVSLASLPRTPNGKINRAALPPPTEAALSTHNVDQSPRTALEAALLAIWSEILKVDKIGIYDNFFDLGGHSLLAIQILSRTRDELSIELPVRILFESPTIVDFAAAIAGHHARTLDKTLLAETLRELETMSEEESKNLLGT
jgi:amino acid adenylation domain-containing protein